MGRHPTVFDLRGGNLHRISLRIQPRGSHPTPSISTFLDHILAQNRAFCQKVDFCVTPPHWGPHGPPMGPMGAPPWAPWGFGLEKMEIIYINHPSLRGSKRGLFKLTDWRQRCIMRLSFVFFVNLRLDPHIPDFLGQDIKPFEF